MRRLVVAGAVALAAVALAVPASANYYDGSGCYWAWSPYYGAMVRTWCPPSYPSYYAPYYQPYYTPYYGPYYYGYGPGLYFNFGFGPRGYYGHKHRW